MLIVKIMSGENLPDEDPRKAHHLFSEVCEVHFMPPRTEAPVAELMKGLMAAYEPKTVERPASVFINFGPAREPAEFFFNGEFGNVYVMNEAGKTISSFCPSPPIDNTVQPAG